MRRLSMWLGVVVCCGMVWCTVASGVMVHRFALSFGCEGSGPGEFLAPHGVAVGAETHDVYVVDEGNKRVQKFNSTGTVVLCEFAPEGGFVDPTEIAVDNSGDPADPSKGDVYVVDLGAGAVDKFSSSCADEHFAILGSGARLFTPGEGGELTVRGIAVSRQGNVWVSVGSGPLFEFSNAIHNVFLLEVKNAFEGAFGGMGVDGEENVYFTPSGEGIVKLASSGVTVSNPFCGEPSGNAVAVDGVGGEVYMDQRTAVVVCRTGGTAVEADELPGAISGSIGKGLLSLSQAVAVDEGEGEDHGDLYVSDRAADKVFLFEAVLLPTVVLGGLSGQGTRGVTLNGSVNPEGREVTACQFEYAERASYEVSKSFDKSVVCAPASIGSGSVPVDVSGRLEGLSPGGEYCYRLVAENSVGVPSRTPVECFVTGPLVSGEFVTEVDTGSAVLHATVDPNGADTHYFVEYGLSEGYGSFLPVAGPPGVDIGGSVGGQSLVLHLQGLRAGTTYHYRFVAVQDGEVFEERPARDHTFTTRLVGVSGLPDGRGWELVSPPDKKGGLIELFQQGGQVQAASDGSGIAYVTTGSTVGEDPAGKPTYSPVLSERTASGWRSRDLSLPGRLPENEDEVAASVNGFLFEYRRFSPDLSSAVVEPQVSGTPPLASGVTERTLYLSNGESFTPLVWSGDVPPGTKIEENPYGGEVSEWKMMFLAATPDLSHVLFKTPMALTSEAIDEETVTNYVPTHVQWNLYDWNDGSLKLVNILPDGKVAYGKFPVPTVKPAGMTHSGGRARGGVPRVMSDDGRFVAWTWGEPYSAETAPTYRGLYMRDLTEERTVRVGGAHAVYQTMSSDGMKVFYLEEGKLFVYEYATETSTELTPGASAGVSESVSDVSDDGSHVYFVAKGVLAAGAVEGEDDNNLYLASESEGKWSVTFIATLSNSDKPSWYAETFSAPFPPRVSSRVSPDGRFLVFMSSRSLTGYDNVDAVSGVPDEEVFLYDSASSALSCVSCDPTGARPAGVFDTDAAELLVDREGVWTAKESSGKDPHSDHWLAGSVPGWDDLSRDPSTYQPRYLSDSGRVFFNSPVGLVPGDSNGLEDVYEWEPLGVGGCGSTGGTGLIRSGEGCVGLISSGTASRESAFYDASESGNDVFFTTTGKLVGEDVDQGYDVYDAHVCTGAVPCPVSPPPLPPCTSAYSCKGTTAGQPELFGPPPSQTFIGQGNTPPSKPIPIHKKQKRVSHACKKRHKHHKCVKHKVHKKHGAKAGRAARHTRYHSTRGGGR